MATKKCPQCISRSTKKNVGFRNKQGYRCNDCGKQFLNKSREVALQKVLWRRYVWERQTIPQLAKQYQRTRQWIRQQLDRAPVTKTCIKPQPVLIVADTMFSNRAFGLCILRAAHLKKNLCWEVSSRETAQIYHECRMRLQEQGFEIIGVVTEGKPGIIEVFWDVPVQMCHFHQSAIMSRYLTSRQKLEAGQALREVALMITNSTEKEIEEHLNSRYQKWELFLNEKSFNPETRRWYYTHKRLRSAYRSIRRNLSLLYT